MIIKHSKRLEKYLRKRKKECDQWAKFNGWLKNWSW